MFVVDMLVNAPPATSKIWATRPDAVQGRSSDVLQFCFEKLLVCPHNGRRDPFAIDDVGHKHGLTVCARDAFAAKSDVRDFKFAYSGRPEQSRGIPVKLS